MLRALRRAALTGLALSAALTTGLTSWPTAQATAAEEASLHLVTMVGPGTAGYAGEFSQRDYRTGLLQRQDAALERIGGPEPLVRWTTALSGFAVEITPSEAASLRESAAVQLVEDDDVRRLAASPATAPALTARSAKRRGGEGTVIGFVDSGLDASGPVFANSPALGPMPRSFRGECVDAETTCNDKVVAAHTFVDAFGTDRLRTGSSLQALDDQGHGTMVASLAAGNRATPTGPARHLAPRFSGVAPDARVAVYKACWEAPDPEDDGCSSVDVVSAIDQAVADRVDVLNLGMSGRQGIDTVDLATLGAVEADIVVVAPAGNAGDRTGHDMPWVLTTGAALTGDSSGVVTLGDGTRFHGTLSPRPLRRAATLVDAEQLALPGASADRVGQCLMGTLDAARADGAVVICQRGEGSRLEKSRAVKLAGGVGMVLVNGPDDELTADLHSVPTLNLTADDGRDLRRQLREGELRVRLLSRSGRDFTPRAAAWSAKGDRRSASIKPDVVAPGVGLLAATTSSSARSWDQISGSSAATALVSGLAAELRERRPRWSAPRIRSAVSTSSTRVPGKVLRTGSGLVDAKAARRTVLLHDLDVTDYRRHLDRTGSTLNIPSATAPSGRTTVVTRALTNAAKRAGYWSVRVTGFDDHRVDVFPRALTLEPGETQTVRIRVSGRGPAEQGFITWRDDRDRLVRMPLRVG